MCAVGGKYPVLLPSPYGNCESQPTFSPSSSLIFRYDKWIFSEEEEESQEILCCRRFSDGKDWSRRNCRKGREGKCGLRKKTVLPGGFWSNPSQWGKRISLKSAYSYLFLCYFSKERKRILLKYLGKFVGNSADADARRKIFSRPAAGMPAKSFKSSFSTPPPFPPSLSVRT